MQKKIAESIECCYTDSINITRKLPVGIQSFEKLRRDGYIYVDKTPFIWKLVQGSNSYFLSRPRRFGKSLFLSTLEAYFLGQKELFHDLYLEKAEEAQALQEGRTAWQAYPVFYLDFNTGNYNCLEALTENLNIFLSRLEEIYGRKDIEKKTAKCFEGLLERACRKTGKQVVILVDEYDKPLLQTIGNLSCRSRRCTAHFVSIGLLNHKKYISDLKLYRLGFPNDEVRYGFLHNLLPAYSDVPFGQTGMSVARFV